MHGLSEWPGNNRKLSTVEERIPRTRLSVMMLIRICGTGNDSKKRRLCRTWAFLTHTDGQDKYENLYVIQRDSVALMLPFVLEDRKDSRSLFAPGANPNNLAYSESHPLSRYAIAVDNDGKFYHSGMSGYYFSGLAENDVQNYVIDKIYMSQTGFTTIWDKTNRKFMSFNPAENQCYNVTSSDGVTRKMLLSQIR